MSIEPGDEVRFFGTTKFLVLEVGPIFGRFWDLSPDSKLPPFSMEMRYARLVKKGEAADRAMAAVMLGTAADDPE